MATKKRTSSAKNKKDLVNNESMSGFTIIEVVLVLAIAGLIFLMVFIALPQLQRAQRDTQRRQDLGRLEGAITQYQTNNNGKIPTQKRSDGTFISSADFIDRYVVGVNGEADDDFVDPLGNPYELQFKETVDVDDGAAYANETDAMTFKVWIYGNAKCDGERVVKADNRPRNYAVQYRLEGSGTYCQDNAG